MSTPSQNNSASTKAQAALREAVKEAVQAELAAIRAELAAIRAELHSLAQAAQAKPKTQDQEEPLRMAVPGQVQQPSYNARAGQQRFREQVVEPDPILLVVKKRQPRESAAPAGGEER
jgi:hypothetical protein